MEIKLKSLVIKDFAGIKEQSFSFDGKDAKIYGDNGTGKTTTANAIQWLLFDKTLDGKQAIIVPKDENNNEIYEVTPYVKATFMIDDKERTFVKESKAKYTKNKMTGSKEYSNSRETKTYINDEPFTITNYKKEVASLIDENIFKLITNPMAFNNLKWEEKRKLLFDICGSLSDEEIIDMSDELNNLREYLVVHDVETRKKVVKDKLKIVNEDIEDIPVRINEAMKSIIDVNEVNQSEIEEKKLTKAEIEKEIFAKENGGLVTELKNQLNDLLLQQKSKREHYESTKNKEYNNTIAQKELDKSNRLNFVTNLNFTIENIERLTNDRNNKLQEHKEISEKIKEVENSIFVESIDDTCSCCGQKLPSEDVEDNRKKARENFNQEKSNKLETLLKERQAIVDAGKKIKPQLDSLNKEKDSIQYKIDNIDKVTAHFDKKLESLSGTTLKFDDTEEGKNISQQIAQLTSRIVRGAHEDDKSIKELKDKLIVVEKELGDFQETLANKKANQRINDRVKELKQKENELIEQKESLNYQLYLIELFNQIKVKAIEDNINKKFKLARFKLFEQFKNGEQKDTCVTTFNGIEFDKGLNNASKINVGLDIIKTLTNHYDVYAPIFIDNAESVTDIYKTSSQQIELIVSESDKVLRLEVV